VNVRKIVITATAAAALCSGLLTGASTAAAATGLTAAGAASSGGTWGRAEEVPGTAALNMGGDAETESVSCGAAGNCSAGGYYIAGSGAVQAFVAGEAGGSWGTAKEVPGSAALNKDGGAAILSVSCASAGNCSAGGDYADGSAHQQALVAGEVNGSWGKAEEVPGTAALNKGGNAAIISLSCASAGNCSAGGYYTDSSKHQQVWVAGETDGVWGTAKEIPGSAALNTADAYLNSVSCGAAGNCSAGGYYTDHGRLQAFVAGEASGSWGTAKEVPGTAALNKDGGAGINSLSCASAGNCSAGGFYTDGSGQLQAWVAGEAGGSWGTAKEVPGAGALNKSGDAQITAVSCGSAGNCSAGGFYTDGSFAEQVFVVGEAGGSWGTAREVPGSAALNKRGAADFQSVSCASAGNCSAGGGYEASTGVSEAYVVSEVNGTWRSAEEVPGSAALNKGAGAQVDSVSCASAGNCSAGGSYLDSSKDSQAFVVSEP
jgi:cytochrome c551/c552